MDLKHRNFNSGTLRATLARVQYATASRGGKAWWLTRLDGEDTSQHLRQKEIPFRRGLGFLEMNFCLNVNESSIF